MTGGSPLTELTTAACAVLNEPDPAGKVELSAEVAASWRNGQVTEIGTTKPPDRPARPALPELRPPRDMPRRRATGEAGRVALIHAIVHIELNAIDLAWDLIARFADHNLPQNYYDDWVDVAADEARHFSLLHIRLGELGATYGDLPAHDGLWEAATDTADDLAARLAVVPLVLEARALDITPTTSARLRDFGDTASAAILDQIAAEEVAHVAAGVRWFEYVCKLRGVEPVATYQRLVRERFKGRLKPPFGDAARAAAGLHSAYYAPLAADTT